MRKAKLTLDPIGKDTRRIRLNSDAGRCCLQQPIENEPIEQTKRFRTACDSVSLKPTRGWFEAKYVFRMQTTLHSLQSSRFLRRERAVLKEREVFAIANRLRSYEPSIATSLVI